MLSWRSFSANLEVKRISGEITDEERRRVLT
jgi:hypothetical protein